MNRKIFLLALCFVIVSVPMLFGAYENDVVNQPLVPTFAEPTIAGPRRLLVDQKATHFVPDRSGALLFDQQATHYTTFDACQNDSIMGFYPRIADNFTVPYDANVDSLVWWGGYWATMTNSIMDFWIEIYPDSVGFNQPMQAAIYGARVGFLETLISAPDNYYVYEAVIPPFPATAGVTYWIVFQPFLTFPPQWGNNCDYPPEWGDGQPQFFKSAYFGFPLWTDAMTVFGRPDETSFQIYGPASAVTFWDFETGWQGWTHTNGQVFPAAWDVRPFDEHTPCPDPGDSSMWIDSDASGGGYSDTALSPVVIPPANMSLLKYGYYNYGGSGSWVNELRAGIKYFTGGVWNVVELAYYPAGQTSGPAWDSLDVSAYAASDSVQVYFYHTDLGTWGYYSAFDNVELKPAIGHDVGCIAVTSPPGGPVAPGDYDVIGQIHNFGASIETFDVKAGVWDTTFGAWTQIFDQTVTLTDFPIGGDSLVNFGMVTLYDTSYFYTEIVTLLADDNPANDTAFVYSWTAMGYGDIVFELDVETPAGDNQLLGVEFDGTYFYVTGGNTGTDPNKVYVIDVAGNLIWTIDQPGHSTGWGWRDVAWDNAYSGPDKIDTLWASVDPNVDGFSIDLTTGTLTHHISYSGQQSPNRALAWMDDSLWFWTANFSSSVYWFDKFGNSGSASNTYAMYGAAYDTDTIYGGWVWWHSQDDPGTGWDGQISQFDPQTMSFTGLIFGYNPTTIVPTTAGGLCFYEGFMDYDVLFALVQGTPDAIIGLYVRDHIVGIAEKPVEETPLVFGLNRIAPNPVKDGATVTYATTKRGPVSLKVYDSAGRLVRTLIDSKNESAGYKTVYWDGTDDNHRSVAAGVYFYRLTAENKTASDKMIVVR